MTDDDEDDGPPPLPGGKFYMTLQGNERLRQELEEKRTGHHRYPSSPTPAPPRQAACLRAATRAANTAKCWPNSNVA